MPSIPTIALNGIDLTADVSGALIRTGRRAVIVADLHLEKGSSFARHGARRLTARCFVSDGRRLVLPAFGAFAGGLDIFDPAIPRLFPDGFRVHLIGGDRVVAIAPRRLAPASYSF